MTRLPPRDIDTPPLLEPLWPAPPAVCAAVSTRQGGVSVGSYASFNLGDHCGDDPAAVATNRTRLAQALHLPSSQSWLRQMHGRRVVHLSNGGATAEADAAWTDRRGVVCAVLAADCLPVLLCDRGDRVVAAAHAGWRGLAAGVLEATVAALPVAPVQLMAWLGPAIGPLSFEVGTEVRTAFVAHSTDATAAFKPATRSGAYLADLYMLARLRLAAAGVRDVYGGELCTYRDAGRFFSYRRDGVTGRMVALIWRR